ncbi:MAG TPA: class I SAM-dependent methyltransferase [Pirellulales bacterium]|jgi:cyclopropane fatty-acyl-phospholipid synthase-like methyltransferase|nr:class I SAM-dependent methyltransferase [Pirellulales bacterium]
MSAPKKSDFEALYAGQAPWDIARAQAVFVAAAKRITGAVLDCGCGTGENALYFAAHGRQVIGIDFLDEPIRRARLKANERGVNAKFLVRDALALGEMSERFDNAIDSGLFHTFSDENRPRYVAGLKSVLKPGGRLFLLCFSDEEPGTQGPRRIAQRELRAAFADGWIVESIEPAVFETAPTPDISFSPGGPKAWFAVIRRVGG